MELQIFGAKLVMSEIEKQLSSVKKVEIKAVKERPPSGALAVDAETVILVLKIATNSALFIRSLIKIIQEIRENNRNSKDKKDGGTKIAIVNKGKPEQKLELPAGEDAVKTFIEQLSKEG